MRKTLFFFIAAFVVALLTVSCDDNKHIISSGEMEEILYDYHLADAMAQQAKGGVCAERSGLSCCSIKEI